MVEESVKVSRSHCNSCGQESKHFVRYELRIEGSEEIEGYGTIGWEDTYELLECCGCENVSMRHSSWFEPTDEHTITIYPPKAVRRPPHWLHGHHGPVPTPIAAVLREVYQAMDSDSRTLALMGARTVLDLLLTDKVGDAGPFPKKLDGLVEAGLLAPTNRAFLEAALDAGSAASHRAHEPTSEDVSAVMDIVENLLQATYHLQSLAERLKETTPQRRSKTKKKTAKKKTAKRTKAKSNQLH